jgi:two-component system response regulator DegU
MAQKAKERKTAANSESSDGMIKIALADDHTIFRDGLRRLLGLESDFMIVAEAKDGTEVMPIL